MHNIVVQDWIHYGQFLIIEAYDFGKEKKTLLLYENTTFEDLVEKGDLTRENVVSIMDNTVTSWKKIIKRCTKAKTILCPTCQKNSCVDPVNYFKVNKYLWYKYGSSDGMMCISCFESRLGRPIDGEDLTECLINRANPYLAKRD